MADLKTDANKKHYFSELESKDLVEIIGKSIEDNVEIKLWQEGKSETDVETYVAKDIVKENLNITLEPQGGLLSKLFSSKLLGKNVFVKIGGGKFQFFGTASFSQDSKKEYKLKFTSNLFKTQQRSNYRLQASHQVRIQFRINENTVHDCLDVSAGGTSFVIPNTLLEYYPKDREFSECRVGVNSFVMDIPGAKIVGQWPYQDRNNEDAEETKIGIAFTNMGKNDEEELFKAINSEARAEEMRKKLQKMKK